MALIEVSKLTKKFEVKSGWSGRDKKALTAVDAVSLQINQSEILGLIGESGSGKSTLGRCMLRLTEPDSGAVFFDDQDLLLLSPKAYISYRKKMQMIFQNPTAALNPLHTVKYTLCEPLKALSDLTEKEALQRAAGLLTDVGLDERFLSRYPHQLSGGQNQRVAIARALAVNPLFLIADEPTSNLDAIFKKQILDLLLSLREKFKLTLMIISHDMRVIAYTADRLAVMYNGTIVESGSKNQVLERPLHPYAVQLIRDSRITEDAGNGIKSAQSKGRTHIEGCPYYNHCPLADQICLKHKPPLNEIEPGRRVACHHV